MKGLKRYKQGSKFLGYLTFSDGGAFFPSYGVYLSVDVVAVFFNGSKFVGNVFVVFNKRVSCFESKHKSLISLLINKPKPFQTNQLGIKLGSCNKVVGDDVLIRDVKSFSNNLDVFI